MAATLRASRARRTRGKLCPGSSTIKTARPGPGLLPQPASGWPTRRYYYLLRMVVSLLEWADDAAFVFSGTWLLPDPNDFYA